MIEKYNPLKTDMLQIMNEEGVAKLELEPKLSESELKKIYSLMATTRAADLKALKLQRQSSKAGKAGTPSKGSGFTLEAKVCGMNPSRPQRKRKPKR